MTPSVPLQPLTGAAQRSMSAFPDMAGSLVLTAGVGRVVPSITARPNPTPPSLKRAAVALPAACPTDAVVSGASVRQFESSLTGGSIYAHISPTGYRKRGGPIWLNLSASPLPSRPKSSGHERTVERLPHGVIYSGKSSPRMVNLMCPFERMAERLTERRRQFLAIALSDNNFDEHERALYEEMREDQTFADTSSAKRKLARHIEQMEEVTDYTVRLAKAADLRIVNLDAERMKRSSKIVPLFPESLEQA